MLARLATLLALTAVVYLPAAQTASATEPAVRIGQTASLAAPTGLRAFLLRADEPSGTSFSRTPSFAWTPYDGATSYDFELATSKTFDDRTIVWSTNGRPTPLRVSAATVPIALPWMTGHPYALYVRVRARTARGLARWSTPFGFNTGPGAVARHLAPDVPGLVRWTPVEGATSYEVWFTTPGVAHAKVISTTTNIADEREIYAVQDPDETTIMLWRVRAVRKLYGALQNELPAVSYGPWSTIFVSVVPPRSTEPLRLLETASDTIGSAAAPAAHNLTPGFVFTGADAPRGSPAGLYRVYVATDNRCVNIVFTGSVVASPAYAPRTSGPVNLGTAATTTTTTTASTTTTTATTTTTTTASTTTGSTTTPATIEFPADGSQTTLSIDGRSITPNEQLGASSATTGGTATTTGSSTIPADLTTSGPFVDLWDLGRPNARYWWTVVPVVQDGNTYQDAMLPQDACEAGRVGEFAKTSTPVVTSATSPYVSGPSAYGRLVAARSSKPSFYRAALIGWVPAPGATGYEVQWSKTKSPWKAASAPVYTAATSLLLDALTPGTWYYRVRGIDPYVPGPVKQMTWSAPVQIKIAKPKFIIQTDVTVRPVKK
jgi:hypothetical protein